MKLRSMIAVVALAAACTWPASASADVPNWPLRSASPVLLHYGSTYQASTVRTHSGVDLAAAEGDDVLAPAEGTVSFAGRVPAGEGATALAVTLILPDGRSVSLMPLSSAAVKTGQRVANGARLGALAGAGDPSVSVEHLHVGLRRGDTYLDPMTLLVAPSAASQTAQQPSTSTSTVHAGNTASAPTAQAASTAVTIGAVTQVPSPTGAGVSSPLTAAGPSAVTAASAPAEMPAGVILASEAGAGVVKAARPAAAGGAAAAVVSSRAGVAGSLRSAAVGALEIAGASVVELALVALGVAGAAVRRSSESPSTARVRPVGQPIAAAADRCYTRRAHFLPRAHQPSQSRGRISPGEVTK